MLYGVQTVNQLTIQAGREKRDSIPCLEIRDWPEAKWRCLAPQLTWYAGWGSRFEGYDNGNWSLDEWKWMVDWSLPHAIVDCLLGHSNASALAESFGDRDFCAGQLDVFRRELAKPNSLDQYFPGDNALNKGGLRLFLIIAQPWGRREHSRQFGRFRCGLRDRQFVHFHQMMDTRRFQRGGPARFIVWPQHRKL